MRKRPSSQLWILLALIGPGIIAANADNDAGGIFAYSLAGAQYGYTLLWALVLVTVSLAVCQEMGARMGAITGKGLADLIREEYGVKMALFAMATLLVANFATTVSEFAGISAATRLFTPGWSQWIIVPGSAVIIWLLVTRSSYRRVTRILLAASVVYLAYCISAFLAHPPWLTVMKQTVWPGAIHLDHDYVFMVINLIGTTITPWGQFYIQSSVRDKAIKPAEYPYTRIDVLFGAFFTNFIAFFIIVACGATLYAVGHRSGLEDAGQVAAALRPIAGSLATVLFAVGLFNASCFGAITVPLSTAYAVTESLGTESGLGYRRQEAPLFVGIFTLLLAVSAITVLVGRNYLTLLILLPNVVGGALLPIILILTLKLINNPRIMGKHTNSRSYNVIAWITTWLLIALTLVLIITTLFPGL
ncbi:MAG: divalent metal cation transporter [Armatimonadetes bacterium]|nr:divalent metal cation transporter [Armatimonadota bacterium]MDE2205127.1 divalent metal cation transporter [Armatimonadota bacterium]